MSVIKPCVEFLFLEPVSLEFNWELRYGASTIDWTGYVCSFIIYHKMDIIGWYYCIHCNHTTTSYTYSAKQNSTDEINRDYQCKINIVEIEKKSVILRECWASLFSVTMWCPVCPTAILNSWTLKAVSCYITVCSPFFNCSISNGDKIKQPHFNCKTLT